jgi:hypothetical protein
VAGHDEEFLMLVPGTEYDENVDLIGPNSFFPNWEAVLLPKGLYLDIERLVSFRVVYEYVHPLGVSERDGGLIASLEKLADREELASHPCQLAIRPRFSHFVSSSFGER